MKISRIISVLALSIVLISCQNENEQEIRKAVSVNDWLLGVGVENADQRELVKILLNDYKELSTAKGEGFSGLEYIEEFEKKLAAVQRSLKENVHPLVGKAPLITLREMNDSIHLAHGVPETYVNYRRSLRE